jgi:LuxR family transcriptional regulator of spore coat protein
MSSSTPNLTPPRFSAALRDIRRGRGLDASQVAGRMGLRLRAYQDFESGRVAPSMEKLRRFAEVVDCDACALAVAILLDVRDLALACVDNKLMTVAALRVVDVHEHLGHDGFLGLTSARGMALVTGDGVGADPANKDPNAGEAAPTPVLTSRQMQCLQWVQAGKSSSVIGQLLGLSPRTVDDHLSDACRRLGVQTRVQAVCAAVSLNLLTL